MIIVVSVFTMVDIILIISLMRNIFKSKMIKKYGKVKQAEVRGCKWIPGRPSRYAIKVCYDYDMQGNEKTKWIIASGKFAKKYEKEKTIEIFTMPNHNSFYLKENNWKIDNVVTSTLIFFFTFFIILFLLFM